MSEEKKETNWVLVYTANGPSEAIVIKSVLETNGIKVKQVQETAGKLFAISMNGLGKVDIYVEEEKYDDAKDLLDSRDK